MKIVPASVFKKKCLALMDDVKNKRQPVVITKRGKPVAKLVPVNGETKEIFGFFRGKGYIVGDCGVCGSVRRRVGQSPLIEGPDTPHLAATMSTC